MLVLTIIAALVAAFSAWAAWRSAVHAKSSVAESRRSADAAVASVAEAKRSADAAEHAAGAAMITADADRAEDHRKREPTLEVTIEKQVEYNGTDVIYRVLNRSAVDLDSVVVHRPIVSTAEGGIIHPVAPTGGDYHDEARLGPIEAGTYERFTLSLGPNEILPDFHVKIVCFVGEESWTRLVRLDEPRRPKPLPPPRMVRKSGPVRRDMGF